MEFNYTKIPSTDKVFPYYLHPYIGIRLHRGNASYPFRALLDTGADQTIFPKDVAESLFIDWKSGFKSQTRGIVGKPVPIWIHDLEIEIISFPNSKIKVKVAFIESGNFGALLGQYGFFEHFKVTFERYKETFSVDLKP